MPNSAISSHEEASASSGLQFRIQIFVPWHHGKSKRWFSIYYIFKHGRQRKEKLLFTLILLLTL